MPFKQIIQPSLSRRFTEIQIASAIALLKRTGAPRMHHQRNRFSIPGKSISGLLTGRKTLVVPMEERALN